MAGVVRTALVLRDFALSEARALLRRRAGDAQAPRRACAYRLGEGAVLFQKLHHTVC